MKIIILEDIKNFAKKYDVKEVKNGYARNFLIPRKLAKPATKDALKELEVRKAEWEKQEEEIKNRLRSAAEELGKKEITFELKTGKKDEVFGSVTKEDILKKLSIFNSQFPIKEKDIGINLQHPLKTIGEHKIEIDLSRGIKAKIKVLIKPRRTAKLSTGLVQ